MSAFGETRGVRLSLNEDGTVDYTLDELCQMVIRCAWCSEPIFPGDQITLYQPEKDMPIPSHAVVYEDYALRLVGCLAWNCAMTGADRSGFWIPDPERPGKGKVQRVLSAFEQIEANLCRGDDSPIIIGDITDIDEASQTTSETLRKENE